jgi:hypothetical protein
MEIIPRERIAQEKVREKSRLRGRCSGKMQARKGLRSKE